MRTTLFSVSVETTRVREFGLQRDFARNPDGPIDWDPSLFRQLKKIQDEPSHKARIFCRIFERTVSKPETAEIYMVYPFSFARHETRDPKDRVIMEKQMERIKELSYYVDGMNQEVRDEFRARLKKINSATFYGEIGYFGNRSRL